MLNGHFLLRPPPELLAPGHETAERRSAPRLGQLIRTPSKRLLPELIDHARLDLV